MRRKPITGPRRTWALGRAEQTEYSGVSVTTRPLYYYPTPGKDKADNATWRRRVGSINPDYAERLLKALGRR